MLAIRSGISAEEWLAGDPQHLEIAIDLLTEEYEEAQNGR